MLVVLVAKGRSFILRGLFFSFFSLIADNEHVRWSLAGTQRAVKHRERLEALECFPPPPHNCQWGGWGGGEYLQLLILLRAPFRASERSQVRAAEPCSLSGLVLCSGLFLQNTTNPIRKEKN